MFKIAISTHVFVYQPLDENLLSLIKANGFSNLEIWGMRPHFDYYQTERIKQLAKFIKAQGMKVAAVHAPFYAHVNQSKAGQRLSIADPNPEARASALTEIFALLEVMPLVDCSLLALHPGGLADEATPQLLENVKESVKILLERCSAMGVKVALENITSQLATPYRVLSLVEEINSPDLGMCLDLGHANLGGDWSEILRRVAPKLWHIHASDNDGAHDSHQFPYEGNIDWERVRDQLQTLQYQGALSWELRSSEGAADILSKIYAISGEIFPFLGQ